MSFIGKTCKMKFYRVKTDGQEYSLKYKDLKFIKDQDKQV